VGAALGGARGGAEAAVHGRTEEAKAMGRGGASGDEAVGLLGGDWWGRVEILMRAGKR
jgi:hypothetical protein